MAVRLSHSLVMVFADLLQAIIPFRLPAHLLTYTPGKSPFSTNQSVFWAIVVYLVTIFGIREYQQSRPALKLTAAFQAHNIILTVGSAILLLLVLEEAIPILWKHGLYYALCDEGAWTTVRMPFSPTCLFFLMLFLRRDWNSIT